MQRETSCKHNVMNAQATCSIAIFFGLLIQATIAAPPLPLPGEELPDEASPAKELPLLEEPVALDLTPVSESAFSGDTSEQSAADNEAEATAADETETEETETASESDADSEEAPESQPVPPAAASHSPGESVIVEPSEDDLEKRIDNLFRIKESNRAWVVRGGDTDGIGMFSLESGPAWDFEFRDEETFEAEFHTNIHWVDGPGRTDLPPRLYDISWHVHLWQPNFIDIPGQNPISVSADFNLGLHADFEDTVREGWRFPGRLLFIQEIGDSDSYWTAGFEYLDLDHIQMIPAGGFVTKTADAELHLYFPRPKLRVRTKSSDSWDEWFYVAGEYRGRAWAIERSATGLDDIVTLSEYRLGVGWEWEPKRHSKDADEDDSPKISFFDVNWLFGRDLEYRSGIGNYRPHDTVMFRMGTRY